MGRYKANIIIAWLLSAVFITPAIIKTVHVYQNECYGELSHSESNQHDCSNCYICQFILSFFTEAALFVSNKTQETLTSKLYLLYQEKGFSSVVLLNYLRAPPALT